MPTPGCQWRSLFQYRVRCSRHRRPSGRAHCPTRLLSALSPEFPAAILIVQHLDPLHRSLKAGGVAHRFNNALSGILGNRYIPRNRDEMTADSRHLLEQVANRSKELTRQLLAIKPLDPTQHSGDRR